MQIFISFRFKKVTLRFNYLLSLILKLIFDVKMNPILLNVFDRNTNVYLAILFTLCFQADFSLSSITFNGQKS